MDTQLITPEAIELFNQVEDFCKSENIVSLTISDEAEAKIAAELGRKLKTFSNNLESMRKELKEPYLQKGREIDLEFNSKKSIVDDRLKKLGDAIRGYQKILEDKRIEDQRKADEAARKERERIEAQARAQREKEEAARKAAEEAQRRAAAATDEKERKAAEAEARRKQAVADEAARKAAVTEEIASSVVAPVIRPAETGKADGVSTRKNWCAEVKDFNAFAAWCVKMERFELLSVNEKNLKNQARMTEDKKEIPGVRFYNAESTNFRG